MSANSKFKVTFELKQHTPIIHFQSKQPGATLRATELKPKFDKFLKEYAFGGSVPKEYKISDDKDALNYKVKISPDLSQAETINSKKSLYFGNMGDGEDKRYKHNPKLLNIEFFSFKKDLLEKIEEFFERFLANTNFGTRQSKGYGSFYLNNKDFNRNLINYIVYGFNSHDWERDIKLLYSFLRQGINLPRPRSPFYTKPAIFSYAKSKGWQWDKKTIKENFFARDLTLQISKHTPSDVLEYSSQEKYLLRDLLGLSSSQEWKSYNARIEKEGNRKVNNEIVIERFKSPITFKIIKENNNYKVYFWVNNSYKTILNESFKIKNGGRNFNLTTPAEFDFNEFLEFAFNIKLNTHIDSDFHNTNEFKSLDRMLKEIKANS